MHRDIVGLECIALVFQIGSIQGFLIHLEVQLSVNNGCIGGHLLVKIQARYVLHLDVMSDYIGQQKPPHPSNELDV